MSVCTCVESTYYNTLPCNLQLLKFEFAHVNHWAYCGNITEIIWEWHQVVLEGSTWVFVPQSPCSVIDKCLRCPNSGFCFIWSPQNISAIHFSSWSQNGQCDCGFGQHMPHSAVHCGSATVSAFTVVILCWILLQWAVSKIAWSVCYCQWHWSALFLFIWVLIMYFWLKRGLLRETKVQSKTSYSFRHKGNRKLLLHQVPVWVNNIRNVNVMTGSGISS
jgi:hypothetical protein